MAQIQISIDDHQVVQGLNRAARRLRNLQPLMEDIGAALERSTDRRFASEVSPSGEPWRSLSARTLARKRNNKILNETGKMRASLSYMADAMSVQVGFSDVKSRWHQFGTNRGIPPRPMLGLSDGDVQEIESLVTEHLSQ
jgi:phage virion morphogenesis protein